MTVGSQDRRAKILEHVTGTGIVRSRDLADLFQVSEMTVRRDLDQLAEDRLVLRIRGGAARLDSAVGRRRGQELTIGMVFPSADHLYPSIAAAAEKEIGAVDARARLLFSNYDPVLERELVDDLVTSGVDGLILAPTTDEENPDWEQMAALGSLSIPVVLVERRFLPHWPIRSLPSVGTSFPAGLATAVRHLGELGHRRIAFFGHVRRMDLEWLRRQWADLVSGHGLDPDGSPWLVDRDFRRWRTSREPESVLDQVRRAGATALICRDDTVALTMAHHAHRLGMAIPDELSLIAYDDDVASMAEPPLTAVAPPKQEIGRLASRMLLDMVAGRTASTTTMHVELDPALVVRASTGPVPDR